MPAQVFMFDSEPWITMTAGDATICLDHAAAIDPSRGEVWFAAFCCKARELGYRPKAALPCYCNPDAAHSPDCGLAKPVMPSAPVWPHDSDLGLLLTDRLPSPLNPFAAPPVERIVPCPRIGPLPRVDGEYTGGVPESDPDLANTMIPVLDRT